MILGIASIVIIIVIIIVFTEKENTTIAEIILIIPILLLILTIGCSFIPSLQPQTITTEQTIVSLQDDSQVNGRFSLFGGTIDEKYYFGYYYKNGNGYKLDKVRADRTTIIETNETTPKIVKYTKEVKAWQVIFLWSGIGAKYDEKNIIYVPIGTIIQEFNLNGGK